MRRANRRSPNLTIALVLATGCLAPVAVEAQQPAASDSVLKGHGSLSETAADRSWTPHSSLRTAAHRNRPLSPVNESHPGASFSGHWGFHDPLRRFAD